PSRNTCSPAWNGPMCSTSMCRSFSDALSRPCDRQACEKAQVEQKVNSSPSSATMLRSTRGKVVPVTSGRAPWPAGRSDGAREPGRGPFRRTALRGIVEVTVETHRYVTQQQAPLRSGGDAFGLDPDQPVLDQRVQALQGVGEIRGEVDPVAALERGHRDLALAHELLDQLRPQDIVLVQLHAAEHRQPALVQGDLPGRQVARVLAEAVADVADGADPQADEVALGVGGLLPGVCR